MFRAVICCALSSSMICALGSSGLRAQALPGNLVDVTTNTLAPDWCHIDFNYTEVPQIQLTVSPQSGGAACADFDRDGWIDIFLAANKDQPSKLYRNLGDGTFVDVAPEYGVDDPSTASSTGIFFDYDNDGDLDLVVAAQLGDNGVSLGPLFRLFRNRGGAAGFTYENVSSTAGFVLAPTVYPTTLGWQGGLAIADYNRDGYLDFASTYWGGLGDGNMWRLFKSAPNPVPGDPADPTYTPRIFVDATIEAGLNFLFLGEPWQAMWFDVNRDGWPDLHINVDFDRDFLFVNNGNGTFTNKIADYKLNGNPPEERNEMGAAQGDIDNDGDVDLHLTNLFEADRFYRCGSSPLATTFVDVAVQTGLDDSMWGWGDSFFDFDNDGDLDHATMSGWKWGALPYYNNFHINLFPQKLADGVTVAWQDATVQVPEFSKVFTTLGNQGRGLTWLDYDMDGDPDLMTTHKYEPAVLYKNTLMSTNRWLQVDLVEAGGSLNTVGARAWLKTADRVQMRDVVVGCSYQNQEPPRLHFGLGPPPPPLVSRGLKLPGAVLHETASGSPLPVGGGGPPGLGGAPAWLVIRWFDKSYQIVHSPAPSTVLTVPHARVNDAGDMDGDGHLTATDQSMLLLLATDPAAFHAAYPDSPGVVVGDLNANGFVDSADYDLWAALPPH